MSDRGRQPLSDIQNRETKKGGNTKRKLQIIDEEMLDMEHNEQTVKRNKVSGEMEHIDQILRGEETSPSWSLNPQ